MLIILFISGSILVIGIYLGICYFIYVTHFVDSLGVLLISVKSVLMPHLSTSGQKEQYQPDSGWYQDWLGCHASLDSLSIHCLTGS